MGRWERGSRVQGNCILHMITWVWLHILRMFLAHIALFNTLLLLPTELFQGFFTSTISYIISYIAVFCWTLSLVWSYFSHQTVLTGGREFVFLPCVFRRTLSRICVPSHCHNLAVINGCFCTPWDLMHVIFRHMSNLVQLSIHQELVLQGIRPVRSSL